jgi:O-antigen ligase
VVRKRIARLCDKIIISGVIGLVVYTPIAFGSVHVRAFSVMELVVIGLVLTWMTKLLCSRDESVNEPLSDRQDLVRQIPKNRFGFVKTPLNVPFLLFVGIVLFQITPLPMSAIRSLSPNTHEIYSNYLPGEEDHLKARLSSLKPETNKTVDSSSNLGNNNLWRTISINPHTTRAELFKILSYGAVFFLIVNNFKTRRVINYLIFAIILVGCFEAVYGFFEYSTGNKNILFLPRKNGTSRLAGTYVSPNHLAGLLEMVIPIAIAFGFCMTSGFFRSKSPEHTFNPEGLPFRAKLALFFNKNNFANIVLLIFIVFLIGALFLSQSRMGIAGFLFSIWIFGIYTLKGFYKKNRLTLAIGGLLGVLFLASWIGLNPLYKRLSTMDELAIKDRTHIWKDAGGIVRDFPIFGTGKGTFADIYQEYKTIPEDITYDHAHNDYVELFSEMGLLGLAVTVIGGGIFTYRIINRLLKRQNAYVKTISVGCLCSIAAIIVHSVADFNMFIPANAFLFSVILALLMLTTHLKGKSRGLKASSGDSLLKEDSNTLQPFNKLSTLRRPLYALIIPFAIFLSIPVLKTCMADMYYRKAKALEESSPANIPLAIPYMEKCISLDKTNSAYHFGLGRMFLQLTKIQGDPNEFERNAVLAAEQFEDTINSNPCYSLAHLGLGVVYNLYRTTNQADKLASIETERSCLNKAVALNPSSYSHNYAAGNVYVKDWNTLPQEDKEVTLKYLRTTIELNPGYFNKVLQSSWRYIQDYNLFKRIIPHTSDSYMGLSRFFDEKMIFRERNVAWEEARRIDGKPILPSIFEDNNFIVNGGFEFEPGSVWDDWRIRKADGAVVSIVNSESVEGNNSLKILFDGTKDVGFHHVTQTIRVDGGAKYLLTGYIRTKDVTSKSGVRIGLNCKNVQKDTEPFLGTCDWKSFSLEFDAPEDCDVVNIKVYRKGLDTVKKELISGIVWIDGLKLSPIT